MPLSVLAPLFDLPLEFVSLQQEITPQDAESSCAAFRAWTLAGPFTDFAATAATIARL